MQDYSKTILSQYAASPVITGLIERFNLATDATADFEAFLLNVFDVSTAVGAGLDIWGKIVGVSRQLDIPSALPFFGFSEAIDPLNPTGGPQPFGQAPFYNSAFSSATTYSLSDDYYRRLILAKAATNIGDLTIPKLNQLLSDILDLRPEITGSIIGIDPLPWTLSAPAQRAYVMDFGNMRMSVVCEFYLSQVQEAIILKSGVFPRPSGVGLFLVQVDPSTTFGFSGSGCQPFGSGTMLGLKGVSK